jgi:branched-chain amino acid aminotransferase
MTTQKSLEQANFSKTALPVMTLAFWNKEKGWGKFTIAEKDSYKIPSEAPGVRFGRAMFEAFKLVCGLFFRIQEHYVRLCYGARKLGMPEPPDWDTFSKAVKELAHIYAPSLKDGQALYFFPELINATTDSLKAFANTEYVLIIKCCYLTPDRNQLFNVYVDTEHDRTNRHFADVKFAGNYAMAAPWESIAQEKGCNSILFTHPFVSDKIRAFEELATSNIFVSVNNKLITPEADGRILAGMTRSTILKINEEVLGKKTRRIDGVIVVQELCERIKKGEKIEAFMTGTAINMGRITSFFAYDEWFELPQVPKEESVFDHLYDELLLIQHGEKHRELTMSYK